MTKSIAVLLVEDGESWSARSADVLDVYAVGKTREEACERLRKALTVHLKVLAEWSLPVPDFTAQVGRTKTDLLEPASQIFLEANAIELV